METKIPPQNKNNTKTVRARSLLDIPGLHQICEKPDELHHIKHVVYNGHTTKTFIHHDLYVVPKYEWLKSVTKLRNVLNIAQEDIIRLQETFWDSSFVESHKEFLQVKYIQVIVR